MRISGCRLPIADCRVGRGSKGRKFRARKFPVVGSSADGSRTLAATRGFTLIELLVVIAILALLAALLVPGVARSLASAARGKCAGNLQQLAVANTARGDDTGFFAPAAADSFGKNLQRWHGTRANKNAAFGSSSGPLASYLGGDGMVKTCPSLKGVAAGFEKGCGGYGYNSLGVGSQFYLTGYRREGATNGMPPRLIERPGETVMFADAAFLDAAGLIEYSFAEPYFFLSESSPVTTTEQAKPSVHFRHNKLAGVVWCDGHISWEPMKTEHSAAYTEHDLGWFGGRDNTLFDPY